ncbi:hypothetical protein ABEF95_011064 [Exophiala dermatitidis]
MAGRLVTVGVSATLSALMTFEVWRLHGRRHVDPVDKLVTSMAATLSAAVLLVDLCSSLPRVGELGPRAPGSRSQGFRYEPLQEGQIRLLQFCQQEADDGLIHLNLLHAKLSHAPEYVALSYSWGTDKQMATVEILVNHQPYTVSQHLADALHRMKKEGISNIWVDAICINQRDILEKGKEVTRMFAIYRTAVMVVVWLGTATGPAEDARRFAKAIEELQGAPEKQHDSRKIFDAALCGMERFLSHQYWSRVWIIQEIAAARRARLFWGPYTFDLRALETLMKEYSAWLDAEVTSPRYAQTVWAVRTACRAQQQPRLLEILGMTSGSETSHSRDKVYGLLGLVSDGSIFVREPNYSEYVSDNALCLEMTAAHLNWYSSADIIFLRSTVPHQRMLPSWCPDYFHFKIHDFDQNLLSYVSFKDANLGWEKRRAFGAAARMNEIFPDTFQVTDGTLTLKGNFVGVISALGSILGEGPENCSFDNRSPTVEVTATEAGKAFRRLLLLCHNQTFGHLSGLDFLALMYALPTAAFRNVQCNRLREWFTSHQEFFHRFCGIFQLPPQSESDGTRIKFRGEAQPFLVREEWKDYFGLNHPTARALPRRGREYPVDSILRSMDCTLREGLRLMCIRDRTLLGWAHRDAQLGDAVWHIEGCTLPAILRRSPDLSQKRGHDVYRLVGHAYVDPVMASGRWIAKENKSRKIHIC